MPYLGKIWFLGYELKNALGQSEYRIFKSTIYVGIIYKPDPDPDPDPQKTGL